MFSAEGSLFMGLAEWWWEPLESAEILHVPTIGLHGSYDTISVLIISRVCLGSPEIPSAQIMLFSISIQGPAKALGVLANHIARIPTAILRLCPLVKPKRVKS